MKHTFVLLNVILALAPLGASAETLSCTDSNVIEQALSIIQESSSPILGKIKILDNPFNTGLNQYFHTRPSLADVLADHDTQCAADVVTNHGRMAMYYGWETVNGSTYISVRLLPKLDGGDDASPASNPIELEPPAPSRWEEVLPRIKKNCADKWHEDYSMQSYCIDEQRRGWLKVNQSDIPVVRPPPSPEPPHNNYTVSSLYPTSPTPVVASPVLTTPAVAAPLPLTSPHSEAYSDGRNARLEYESWVNGISEGEYRSGILFWAAHRSDKKPVECPVISAGFQSGCMDARRRLTPSDARRTRELDFKLGWNSL